MCKCKGKGKKLCPVSLGLSLGLVAALFVLIMPLFSAVAAPTSEQWHAALMMFVQGLVGGFFIALFYDLISCLCPGRCCKGKDGCACNCSCCNGSDKPVVK